MFIRLVLYTAMLILQMSQKKTGNWCDIRHFRLSLSHDEVSQSLPSFNCYLNWGLEYHTWANLVGYILGYVLIYGYPSTYMPIEAPAYDKQ